MKMTPVFYLAVLLLIAGKVTAEESAKASAQPTIVAVEVSAPPAKPVFAEKTMNLTGIVSGQNKLNESIGVETLAKIVTPLLLRGAAVPAQTSVQLGGVQSCGYCAKVKLYCLGQADVPKPIEIGFWAIQGLTEIDPKKPVVDLELRMTEKGQLVLKATPLQHPDELSFIDANKLPAPEEVSPPVLVLKEESVNKTEPSAK